MEFRSKSVASGGPEKKWQPTLCRNKWSPAELAHQLVIELFPVCVYERILASG